MDKKLLKTWLLDNKRGVYSVIVETYQDQANTLKPAFFLDWLARELDVKIEDLSVVKLSTALRSFRHSGKQNAKGAKGDKKVGTEAAKNKYDFKDAFEIKSEEKNAPGSFKIE